MVFAAFRRRSKTRKISMIDAQRGLEDSAAREHAVASLASVLVQAPAGSGKTTLLASRYLRLLALVDAPERILALTFTRRAAQEMRERVLNALAAARLAQCPAGMNRQTWLLAVAAKRHLDLTQLDLEAQPTRLRIETIDAFNAWLANQLPIAAGIGSGLRVLTDARPSYEDAARRALAHVESGPLGDAVDRVLMLDDQRWRKLVKLLADMLSSRDRWLPLLAGRLRAAIAMDEARLAGVRAHFDEDLCLLVTRVLLRAQEVLGEERLAALSPLMRGAAQRLGNASPMAAWLLDETPLRPEARDIARWRCVAKLLLTAEGSLRKRVTVAEGFPADSRDKPRMLDLLAEFERDAPAAEILAELRTLPDPVYSDEQWTRVREIAQVLVLAAAELDGVFREQGAMDFPAVSLAALRALGTAAQPTDLTLRLDYRLQHILVDEFQDTSSAQLELVRQLIAGWQSGDGRTLFCVGDPMQSIYGFRQAEVRAFLELAEEGIGEVRFDVERLQTNFRSAESIVQWINGCFARLMPLSDDRNRGAIAFRPSAAAGRQSEPHDAGVKLSAFATRAAESHAIADLIGAAIEQHPGWRIAVLVRAKSHARGIAVSLRARNIAFHAVDIEPLQDRAIVRDIIMLTRALLHLGDRIAWLALLRAPWAGLCLADLLTLARCAALVWDALQDDAVLTRLSEDGRSRCRRIRMTLDAAFIVRNDSSVARWIERTWLALGGPSCAASSQELTLADAAFSRLRVLEERGMPDAADLPHSFADLFADHGSAGAVEIMTIHKAKGLEFDLVVLPALDRPVPRNRDQLLLSHQFARAGRDGMVMAARPPVSAASDPLFEFLRRQLRDASALEAQRLLYVACTRAKWQLRLTAVVGSAHETEDTDEDSAPRKAWTPRTGSLLGALWPVVGREFAARQGEAPPDAAAAGDEAPRGGPLWRVPVDWSPRLPAAFAANESIAPAPITRDETPVFDWAGETARRVGSLVHAELQSMDLPGSNAAAIRARSDHFRRWLALHGVPSDRLEQATARVTDALLGVHQDPRGRWILKSGYRDDYREHALSGHWRGDVLRAVFDRSFIDEEGVRWVIDYKTSQHLGGGLEDFLDREVERYRPQLERYARLATRLGPEPVRLGLYFPLMAAWREWAAPQFEVDEARALDI
jgi:ATP-dependent helicase/nuclease subunit A